MIVKDLKYLEFYISLFPIVLNLFKQYIDTGVIIIGFDHLGFIVSVILCVTILRQYLENRTMIFGSPRVVLKYRPDDSEITLARKLYFGMFAALLIFLICGMIINWGINSHGKLTKVIYSKNEVNTLHTR